MAQLSDNVKTYTGAKVAACIPINLTDKEGYRLELFEFDDISIVVIEKDDIVEFEVAYDKFSDAVAKYHATAKLLEKNELSLSELKELFMDGEFLDFRIPGEE